MAVYVMSDIHGMYDAYRTMLDTIRFSDQDELYILGDVVDRGSDPIKVLQDMIYRPNVYPLWGNHDLIAYAILKNTAVDITVDNVNTQLDADLISAIMDWQLEGGDTTIQQFTTLSQNERSVLLDYFEEFSLYDIVEKGNHVFILSHTGNLTAGKALEQHTVQELTEQRADYSRRIYKNPHTFVISGHTPTLFLTQKAEIYHNQNNICIDCGAVFGGKLACLRLDDFAEFYV